MAIKVGINENVRLNAENTVVNEKGTLVIAFQQGANISEIDTDDLINSTAKVRGTSSTTNIMLWPIEVEQGGVPRETERIAKDVANLRDQLEHILEGYMTKPEAKLDAYAGLSLTKDNIGEMLQKQSTIETMYKNLTTQFVAKVKGLSADALAEEFRLLLVRRSENNHYGTLRRSFITDNPFFESMKVPANASKVKFTKYEINKGLDKAEAVAKPEAVADGQDTTTADDILGVR